MSKKIPCLYIFSGLPASGKTTLSRLLAEAKNAVHLRIDTIEQAIRDLCSFKVEGEGYRLAYRIASDNLSVGNCVIADSCNPIELTRNEWEQVAINLGCNFINIEINCSDNFEHRQRVETRSNDILNLSLPDWSKVQSRDFEPWVRERILIDTSKKTPQKSLYELISKIEDWPNTYEPSVRQGK